MRVFVTGASGHIGSALVPELIKAKHEVIGLARSDASAAKLEKQGAKVLRGTLDDLALLRDAAASADGVIHLAYKHDIVYAGQYAKAAADDKGVVEALGNALVGSNKPFVGTAGTMMAAEIAKGRAATEEDVRESGPRIDAENFTVGLAQKGVRSSVIRLAPSVHSDLDHEGFVPTLIKMARKNGFAAYVGEGTQRWPALHTLDAARLYRLALERAPAGSRLHGAADEGVRFRDIAEAIAKGIGVPARSVTPDEAATYLGFLAGFSQTDNPTSSDRTRKLLDWTPTHPGLLDDIRAGHYFAS